MKLKLSLLVFSVAFSAALPAQAASPSLGGLSPRGAQRGREVEVTFSGGNLDDAKELMFYEPGITVSKFEVVNTNVVKTLLQISADCQLGAHRFRIRTATGISDLKHFMVGNLPEVNEIEPNSDFQVPQVVALNSTINGTADNEDVDYYVVEAKKGDRITAEVEGIRLGVTLFDVYVAILNEARFELSSSDDNALVYQDGVASIIAPEDGKYIVQVRESSYQGNGACIYRVHVGTFPRPTGVVPAGAKPGETVTVRFVGDVAGEIQQTFTIPADASERYPLFATDDKGVSPSPNWIRICDFGNSVEAEPNDTHDTATRFEAPMALNGVISDPKDLDFFRFTAKQGQVFDIRVYGRALRSPIDPILYVAVAGGGIIAGNDDNAGPDSFIRFTAPSDGDYIVYVIDHLGNGGVNYAYRIELTPIKPKLVLSAAEFVQYVQPTVSIPKGNRFPLMINASRIDFGGPLALKGIDLPPGVTMECPEMRPDLATVSVIFHATPEAETSGAFVDLVGQLVDPNNQISGRLVQDVVLVRGQNQIPFWTESVPRMAVAVTEAAPFEVEIVEPKVPLVLDGQMNLKVIAKRKEGFTAPIKIDLLWFPPGLNASRSIAIAEGQTEVLLPMNAAGNAPITEWKISVTGTATVGNGPIVVCSKFSNLKVADRYMTFAYDQAAVEQGKETELVVKVTKNVDFPGEADVTLIGLPPNSSTTPLKVTKDTTELVFKVKAAMDTPAGTHRNLFCQVVVQENGEPVVHNLGAGQLRVDVPLPPKADAPPPMPMPVVQAPMPEQPMAKRLTRLEQLRLEQQEREKKAKEQK